MAEYRTTFREKNGKVYIDREFSIGVGRWATVTRLAAKSTSEAVKKLPASWRNEQSEIGAIEDRVPDGDLADQSISSDPLNGQRMDSADLKEN